MILSHNFPEQYNRVLHLLLKSSEAQSCSPVLWCDLINTLGQGWLRFQPESSMEEFRQQVLQYTTQQTLLDVHRVRLNRIKLLISIIVTFFLFLDDGNSHYIVPALFKRTTTSRALWIVSKVSTLCPRCGLFPPDDRARIVLCHAQN